MERIKKIYLLLVAYGGCIFDLLNHPYRGKKDFYQVFRLEDRHGEIFGPVRLFTISFKMWPWFDKGFLSEPWSYSGIQVKHICKGEEFEIELSYFSNGKRMVNHLGTCKKGLEHFIRIQFTEFGEHGVMKFVATLGPTRFFNEVSSQGYLNRINKVGYIIKN